MAYYEIIIHWKEAIRMSSTDRITFYFTESDSKPTAADIDKIGKKHIDIAGRRWREKPADINVIQKDEYDKAPNHIKISLSDY